MRSLNNKTPKVTVPERIWAAPPYDDPGWETGAGEWDVSENWAAEGKECFIRINLHQAEVAAAYERAAHEAWKYGGSGFEKAIRTIATPDQTAALDKLIAEAEALAVEKTAAMVRTWRNTTPMTGEECANAILAAIPQKDAPND